MIKHPWTWGSNEVFEAEKTRVVSAILKVLEGKKMPAETLSLVMQAQRWSTLPLQSGILPLVQRRKSKSFKANSLEWLKRKHFYSEICSIVWFSLSRKITNPARNPRARSRERSAVSVSEKPAKESETRAQSRAQDRRKLSANEMSQEATTCTLGGVNMGRFFLFLVLHDDDPATQEGKIISTNLSVIYKRPLSLILFVWGCLTFGWHVVNSLCFWFGNNSLPSSWSIRKRKSRLSFLLCLLYCKISLKMINNLVICLK